MQRARRVPDGLKGAHAGAGCADVHRGAEGRTGRDIELDRPILKPFYRGHGRDVLEGTPDAGWAAATVLDVSLRGVPESAGRPVQDAHSGYAGGRPGVDRHEAAEAPQLRRGKRVIHGADSRVEKISNLAFDDRVFGAVDDSPLRHARDSERGG